MKRKRLEEVVLNLLLILRYSFLKELLVESINADNFLCKNIFSVTICILNNLTFMPFKPDAIVNTI